MASQLKFKFLTKRFKILIKRTEKKQEGEPLIKRAFKNETPSHKISTPNFKHKVIITVLEDAFDKIRGLTFFENSRFWKNVNFLERI